MWREDGIEVGVDANANDDANADVDLDGVEEEECLFSLLCDSTTAEPILQDLRYPIADYWFYYASDPLRTGEYQIAQCKKAFN